MEHGRGAEPLKLEPVQPIGSETVHGRGQRYVPGQGRRCEPVTLTIERWPEETKALGNRLRERRVELGISLRDGAKVLGLELNMMSKIERGQFRFDLVEASRRLFESTRPQA